MFLEGNPIEHDIYYKVKLLNCVPNLKTLDGATVWRRTSLQSRIVNDDLKYTDLCSRTPASVDKYAQLSRRSAIQQSNSSILNNLNGTMLTLQSMGHPQQQQQSLPEQPLLPPDLRHLGSLEIPSGRYSTAAKRTAKRTADLGPRLVVGDLSQHCDISLLPAHLQETLRQQHQRLGASPRRVGSERSLMSSVSQCGQARTAGTSTGNADSNSTCARTSEEAGAGGEEGESVATEAAAAAAGRPPRSRSALPWRNPPSVAPNYNTKVLSRRHPKANESDSSVPTEGGGEPHRRSSKPTGTRASSQPPSRNKSASVPVAPPSTPATTAHGSIGSASVHNVVSASVQLRNRSASTSPRKSSPNKGKSSAAPDKEVAAVSASLTSETSQWMNPHLNLALTARQASGKYRYNDQGPESPGFDSRLMESTNNSSLYILQQSFDFDKRSSANGDLSSLRGRGKTRNERHANATAGVAVASTSGRSIATSASPSGPRSVAQTRTSLSRASFSAEMLRVQLEEERVARELVEARTFSRPITPTPSRNTGSHSPYPQYSNEFVSAHERNPDYTILRFSGASPAKRHTAGEGRGSDCVGRSFSPAGSMSRALSPHQQQRLARHDSFGSLSVATSLTSPSRLTGVERILRAYGVEPLVQKPAPEFRLSSAVASSHHDHVPVPVPAPAPSSSSSAQSSTKMHAYSDESKQSGTAHASPVAEGRDESPYRRFLKLRDRLSNKYVQSEPAADLSGAERHLPSASHVAPIPQPRRSSTGYTYDFVRKMDIENMDPVATADLGEIESKIVELQQQDMQFRQLKEQYQQQYQVQYEQALKDRNVVPPSGSEHSPLSFSHGEVTDQKHHHSASDVALAPRSSPPPPPLPAVGAGYDVLYDLIHRRRAVLEKITQPKELSPERGRGAWSPPGADQQDISNAISGLKHRQEASVNVVQSMTRDRVVAPLPARDSLAQVTLSTPALHASINNYMFMAQSSSPIAAAAAEVARVSSPSDTKKNSFLSRLATNNPYMQNLGLPAPKGAPLTDPSASIQSYTAPAATYTYPAAPASYIPHTTPGYVATTPNHASSTAMASHVNTAMQSSVANSSNSLAMAIQSLQEKQARDLMSLRRP